MKRTVQMASAGVPSLKPGARSLARITRSFSPKRLARLTRRLARHERERHAMLDPYTRARTRLRTPAELDTDARSIL